jgi:hypothetical protein
MTAGTGIVRGRGTITVEIAGLRALNKIVGDKDTSTTTRCESTEVRCLTRAHKEKKSMNRIAIAAAGLVLLAATPVVAASANDVPDNPQVQFEHGIPYISGGFGIDERQTLLEEAKDDNLELSFALRNKDYLGGANVLIKDSKGNNVIETTSDGPLLFAKLPAGAYTVEATAEGRTLTQVAHVPAKGRARLFFAWPSKESASERMASN